MLDRYLHRCLPEGTHFFSRISSILEKNFRQKRPIAENRCKKYVSVPWLQLSACLEEHFENDYAFFLCFLVLRLVNLRLVELDQFGQH